MSKLPMIVGGVGTFVGAAVLGFVAVLAREASQSNKEVHALQAQVAQLEGELAVLEGHGRPNVTTDFSAEVNLPVIKESAYLDPLASVLGEVIVGSDVYVAPFASIRGDEGQPINIGDETNVQDGVVVHALETQSHGKAVPNRTYEVNGKPYAVYIGRRVSLAHQSQVHGPARIDDDVFIGMQALVFKSWIGHNSVVEPGAKVIGVTIPPNHYVPAGMVVTDAATAARLPEITEDYGFKGLNEAVVHVNTSFAHGYDAAAHPEAAAPEGGHAPAAAAPEHAPSGH